MSIVKTFGGHCEIQVADISSSVNQLLPAFDPSHIQFRKVALIEPINSWKTLTYTFEASSQDYIESALQPFIQTFSDQGLFPIVALRFGMVSGTDTPIWRPWEQMVLTRVRTSYRADSSSGPLVTVQFVDLLWLLNTSYHVMAYKGQVSQIIQSIWNNDGGGNGSNQIIEPTQLVGHSDFTGIWYQCRETDWEFVLRSLLPAAQNSAGVAGYRIFVRDNYLRFHSPGYQSAPPLQLPYSAGTQGFNFMAVEDNSVMLAGEDGGLGYRIATVDPIKGMAYLSEADPANLIKFANVRPGYQNWNYTYSHIGPNTLSTEVTRNQQAYAAVNNELYQVELSAKKCLDVRVGDALQILAGSSGTSQYSGYWLVNRSQITIDQGVLSSRYILTRGEYNQPQRQSTQDPTTISSSSDSAGIAFTAPAGNSSQAQPLPSSSATLVDVQPAG